MNRERLKNRAKRRLSNTYLQWLILLIVPYPLLGFLLFITLFALSWSTSIFMQLLLGFFLLVLLFLTSILQTLPPLAGIQTYRHRQLDLSRIINYYQERSIHLFVLLFLKQLYILLWSCLFIVPGIIKSYGYRMSLYLMEKNATLSPNQAIKLSDQLLQGYKFDLFILDMSFILWDFLVALTGGLASFYVIPYKKTTEVAFFSQIERKHRRSRRKRTEQ